MASGSWTQQWQQLGLTNPKALTEARLQLHWAAQLVASVGNALIDHRSDDSQSNLGWDDRRGALLGHSTPDGLCAGLRLSDLTRLLLSESRNSASELRLHGQTLAQGFDWLTSPYTAIGRKDAGANSPNRRRSESSRSRRESPAASSRSLGRRLSDRHRHTG